MTQTTLSSIPDTIQALLDAGAAHAAVQSLPGGKIPFLVLPEGYTAEGLESMLPAPTRKSGTVHLTDTAAFNFYVKKHCIEGETVIYADIDAVANKFKLNAVLNDHGPGSDITGWKDHQCLFVPTQSVEWLRWLSKDRKPFNQAEFAAWLEDNLGDIAAVEGMPSGADILQMSLGFEATAEKRLRSKINLQSGGTRFEFVDDEDKDTRTSMQVFERFSLGLPVFEGSKSAYPVETRLKYREKDGRVTFWYELIRPDRVFKAAIADELAAITEATGMPVISGRIE